MKPTGFGSRAMLAALENSASRESSPGQQRLLPASNTLVVQMEAMARSAPTPTIQGFTNLPDGMQLTVSLTAPVARCYPNCLPKDASAIVQAGRFVASYGTLQHGSYKLTVTAPVFQTPAVLNVVGQSGEKLRGPNVLQLGAGITMVNYVATVEF